MSPRRTAPRRHRIVLVGAAATFPRLPARLGRAGVRLDRIVVLQPRAVPAGAPMSRWRRFGACDTLVVTSRAAVDAFLRRPSVLARLRAEGRPEVLAIGPGTREALRGVGLPPTWTASTGGSAAIGRHLAHRPARRILYPRSARAGSALPRALRRAGHRVLDLVVYDLAPPRPLGPRALGQLRGADRIVLTSPSALDYLVASVPAPAIALLGPGRRVVAIGPRTARAARARGLRDVRCAPSVAEQRFSRYLLREVRDVP